MHEEQTYLAHYDTTTNRLVLAVWDESERFNTIKRHEKCTQIAMSDGALTVAQQGSSSSINLGLAHRLLTSAKKAVDSARSPDYSNLNLDQSLLKELSQERGERFITVDGVEYAVWSRDNKNGTFTVSIQTSSQYRNTQREGKIGFTVDGNGEIQSIFINNVPVNKIPDDRKELPKKVFSSAARMYQWTKIEEWTRGKSDQTSGFQFCHDNRYWIARYTPDTQTLSLAPWEGPRSWNTLFIQDRRASVRMDTTTGSLVLEGRGDPELVTEDSVPQLLEAASHVASMMTHPPAVDAMGVPSEDLTTLRAAAQKIKDRYLLREPGKSSDPEWIQINEKLYAVWVKILPGGKFAVNVQDSKLYNAGDLKNKIGLTINDAGIIESIYINSLPESKIPDEQLPLIKDCFMALLQATTKFAPGPPHEGNQASIRVEALLRSPERIPFYHLQEMGIHISNWIRNTGAHPTLKVTFVADDLSLMPGIDAGGLSRAYLDKLFSGISRNACLRLFSTDTSKEAVQLVPVERHKSEYEAIGKIFAVCWSSRHGAGVWDRTLLTGLHFSPDLFKIIFSLSWEECQRPFVDQTRVRLQDTILASGIGQSNPYFAALSICKQEQCIATLLAKKEVIDLDGFSRMQEEIKNLRLVVRTQSGQEQITTQSKIDSLQETLNRSKQIFGMCSLVQGLENSMFADKDDSDIYSEVVAAIRKEPSARTQKESALLQALTQKTMELANDPDFVDKIMKEQGLDIEAVRHIALGMQAAIIPRQYQTKETAWQAVRSTQPQVFSNKVQGSLTPQQIADSIRPAQGEIEDATFQQYKTWLQTWITGQATEEEARQFVMWATGTTGLSSTGILLHMNRRHGQLSPYPNAHTCSNTVDISLPGSVHATQREQYETQEGFIAFVKEAMRHVSFSNA